MRSETIRSAAVLPTGFSFNTDGAAIYMSMAVLLLLPRRSTSS
jgi:Na+/H+-dicarboxylate symporter